MEQLVTGTSDASILLVEGFHGGSHKQLMSSLEHILIEKGEKVCLITLPPNKWHWRARTGALSLAASIPRCTNERGFRVLFTSAVFSLAELLALRPDLAAIPRKFLYFHENQLTYPLRSTGKNATPVKPDYQFAYIQVLSCLVADEVLFNSAFNMDSFYERLPAFLSSGLPTPPSPKVPDPRKLVDEVLRPKSRVLHFLVDPPPLEGILQLPEGTDRRLAVEKQAQRIRDRGQEPLRVLWNHRWDYDKNPVDFFRVIFDLAGESVDEAFFERGKETFRPSTGDSMEEERKKYKLPLVVSTETKPKLVLHILGGCGQDIPRIFPMAHARLLGNACVKLANWGHLESKEAYWKALADCDVVVSTAIHEFFGVSVVEAVSVGCVPLLPQRLSYTELVRDAGCLYRTTPQLRKQLSQWMRAPEVLRGEASVALLAAYGQAPGEEKPWLVNGVLEHDGLKETFVKLFN